MVQFVDVANFSVQQVETEPHYFNQHVFLRGQKIHVVLVILERDVDDVGEKVVVALNLLQLLLDGGSDFVVRGEEHGQILGLLQSPRVGHDLEMRREIIR